MIMYIICIYFTDTMVGLSMSAFHIARSIAPAVGAILLEKWGLSALASFGMLSSIAVLTVMLFKSNVIAK